MKDNIFREYDIRGKYPTEINEEVSYNIGLGYGSFLQEYLFQSKCVLGRDIRLSSPYLHEHLLKGLLDSGIDVIDYGIVTTPMHYYTRKINNLYGIMITASHNPKDENGFKFSFDPYANARGMMISDFKDYIKKGNFKKENGNLEEKDITNEYIGYVIDHIKLGKKRLKVVLDTANATTGIIARKIYEKLNIDLVMINENIDGNFPNHHPDPSVEDNLEQLKNKVLEVKADVGFSFDGDGDRIGIISNNGKLVSIEDYSIILLRNMIDKVKVKKFLYDAKSSDTFKDEILKLGGTPIICRTGSSYTMEKVARENLAYGMQYVGHISLNDRVFDTESTMMSSLRLVEVLSRTDKTLDELINTIPHYFNTPEEKFTSRDDIKRIVIENIKKYCIKEGFKYIEIDGLKVMFKDSWAYVRCSNTGPNITLRCESKNEKDLDNIHKLFKTLIEVFNK